jgi:hypothetical protein
MSGLEELKPGDLIRVVDSVGAQRTKRALGPATQGGTFPVVWACREEEWQAATAENREPEGMPWPAEDVSAVNDR